MTLINNIKAILLLNKTQRKGKLRFETKKFIIESLDGITIRLREKNQGSGCVGSSVTRPLSRRSLVEFLNFITVIEKPSLY